MSSRHLAYIGLAAAILVTALGGCAHRAGVPRHPAQVPGYHKSPPDLAGEDVSALAGRRILVDPGHGGRFVGAVGDNGLTEAEINLGVALYLQGLLQWAGADVHLTRTVDRDFLSPADSSLTADLAARIAICDSLQPDVFLSIHHNSTASRDPRINETQTYHPLGRNGVDRDLALCVHRQLVRALEIEPAKILPGGFYVLRHAPVPAVLGEPAMLSNPVIEGRLSQARSLELEARAYFLGLRDYFAGGTPRWVTTVPDTVQGKNPPHLAWTFDAGSPTAPGPDPSTITVQIDGVPVPHRLSPDGRTVSVNRSLLPTASSIAVFGRNLAGRAAATRSHMVVPHHVAGRCLAILDHRGRALLVYDQGDMAIRLGRSGSDANDIPLPRGRGRQGWFLLDSVPDDLQAMVIKSELGDGTVEEHQGSEPSLAQLDGPWSWVMLHNPESWIDDDVPGGHWRLRAGGASTPLDLEQWPERHHHASWPAVPVSDDQPLWLEADGALPLLRAPTSGPVDPHLTWTPLLPALVGRRVAIDARGGGSDEQGRGPLGTRGSDLNLAVAHRLAALLRGAGCRVLMVRDDDLHTPEPTKVQRASEFGAEFYLAIGRGVPSVHHHPGSRVGQPWSASLVAALDPLLADSLTVTPAYDYVLRHTACPATVVLLESPANLTDAGEDRLRAPAWQNAVARALMRGLVDQLAPETPWRLPHQLVGALGDRAIALDRIDHLRLNGNFNWIRPSGHSSDQPVASWVAGDPGLPVAGTHQVLEFHAGPHWQLWTLTRQSAGDWDGRVFMENR